MKKRLHLVEATIPIEFAEFAEARYNTRKNNFRISSLILIGINDDISLSFTFNQFIFNNSCRSNAGRQQAT